MLTNRRVMRLMFGVSAVVATAALLLNLLNWQRQASVDWPAFTNMFGLLILTVTGALDPPQGRLRLVLSAIALGLIFPSAFLLISG